MVCGCVVVFCLVCVVILLRWFDVLYFVLVWHDVWCFVSCCVVSSRVVLICFVLVLLVSCVRCFDLAFFCLCCGVVLRCALCCSVLSWYVLRWFVLVCFCCFFSLGSRYVAMFAVVLLLFLLGLGSFVLCWFGLS